MKARFELLNVDDMEAKVTITMKVKEWRHLKTQLSESWPSWQLSAAITHVVRAAEDSFDSPVDLNV